MTRALAVRPLERPPDATVLVPGSKSITNRALLCAALAAGRSTLDGALLADDTEAMIDAVQALGAVVEGAGPDLGRMFPPGGGGSSPDAEAGPRPPSAGWEPTRLTVTGIGGALPAAASVDARLSGTTSRFIAPVLAAGPGIYRLDAAPPMRARPMGPAIDALRALGAEVAEDGEPGHLPITITGPAAGGRVALPGHVSSQFLSGLLLAGPLFADGVTVELTSSLVSVPYVHMTGAVMQAFGVDTGDSLTVAPGRYRPVDYAIEPDASAASYFFAAAAITGGRVRIEGLGGTTVQGDVAFVDVLERMGATVTRSAGAIEVRGTGRLTGVEVDLADLSDTAQTLAVVAPFADSPTTVTGIGFIRGKETDRIGHTVRELRRCGIDADEGDDGFTVRPGTPQPAQVDTYDDHRMAMSFALFGLVVPGIEINDPGCVAKTFPGYFAALDQLR